MRSLAIALAAAFALSAGAALGHSTNCIDCHPAEAEQFKASVHQGVVRCQECHGGANHYDLSNDEWAGYAKNVTSQPERGTPAPRLPFDHGATFRGKASRSEVPERCGTCHADVERMNPYGLLTDQLASYWVSGHGKQLKRAGDEKVAVCIDCHGAHDVLRHDNPASRTYFKNIPHTCGVCHADAALMSAYNRSHEIPDQYRRSIHGQNVLEKGDAGSPTCTTCHGSHAAAPPGYLQVSHVCGRCHKQIEDYFLPSIHGRIPVMARCVGCHGKDGNSKNHLIEKASLPLDGLVKAYLQVRAAEPVTENEARAKFREVLNTHPEGLRLEEVCSRCHTPGRRRDPHAMFFESSDENARQLGEELADRLRSAQFEYAQTAERLDRLARGVLLLKDEALRVEDARTEMMALTAFIHTLDREQIAEREEKIREICDEVQASLNQKETGITRWKVSTLPIWLFIAAFSVLMYRKYLELRRAYVRTADVEPMPVAATIEAPSCPIAMVPPRRKFFDALLAAMGTLSGVALLWPAIAYVLPARRRGGAMDRVTAGKEDGWPVWEARKISVTGKPVVVVRNDKGFAAYSAICTHLGCIVHWNGSKREFECPCHAAVFDAEGKVVSGPPPSALPPYSASVVQGEVIVSPAKSG